MADPITIVDHRPAWPEEFQRLAAPIRASLGPLALAIHHIGSTAVPELAAKDIIDVQITVATLDDPAIEPALVQAGLQRTAITGDHLPPGATLEDRELRKHVYKCPPSARPANVHVREQGRFNQRYPLLCRDYLRTHPAAAAAYGQIKQQLARIVGADVEAYYDVKDPTFDLLMVGAENWAASTGWEQPPSDA